MTPQVSKISTGVVAPHSPRVAMNRPVVVPTPVGEAEDSLLHGASRLWFGAMHPGLQVRLFRRKIVTDAPFADVEMRIAAESYFHLWVNSEYVTRGPVFHHTGTLPVARLDLTHLWRKGENVIAALVFCAGFPSHKVPTGEPGLWSAIRVRDQVGCEAWTLSDHQWAVSDQVGWRQHAVRHGYALGPVEVLDASKHTWGWQEIDFDDSAWPRAEIVTGSTEHTIEPIELDLPAMRFGHADVKKFVGAWSVQATPAPLDPGQPCEDLGEWLNDEPWQPINDSVAAQWDNNAQSLTVNNLKKDEGVALVFDFESEQVGNLLFECETESLGTIEVGWSEVINQGKPLMTHKGTTYVDRLIARIGWQRWEALQFTGLRYVVLILRGFEGSVRFSKIGVRSSTAAPNLQTDFISSDKRLNEIWSLCTRTFELGTQETIIDCPSREQAPYLGDGHFVGRWIGDFSGDYSHWRYLIELGFGSQADDGLLRDAPLMPVRRSLIDYVLLTVMAVRDYVQVTGDDALGRKYLGNCRRAMRYFDRRVDAKNLLMANEISGIRQEVTWDIAGPPRRTDALDPHLFIDHPGLGGHNVGDPGIERRGRSAALNALYILANEAMSELETQFGLADKAAERTAMSRRVRAAASLTYWDAKRGMFVDAVDENDRQYPQISEQTNILAALAKLSTPTAYPALLRRVMQPDPSVARCGPYFYGYLLPLMCRYDMHREALALVREKWGAMLDGGATSLWETFAGDQMDSWCHPWSAAPAPFFIHEILGLRWHRSKPNHATLRPRYDLLSQASGQLPTAFGLIEIKWRTDAGKVYFSGSHPTDLQVELYRCDDYEPTIVTSPWQIELS